MRRWMMIFVAISLLGGVSPAFAEQEKKPEAVVERMTVKFVRGVTNMATAIVELPKQSYLTVRDMGGPGYVVGPLKGVGMTVYRAFIGAAETVFFLVPQPGYYDPMIDPEYVWQGWEEYRPANGTQTEPAKPGQEG
ncbi:MAG: exosortase system-associated protein, TIGR04073 family [Geobacter sp.]|nr:exosortase system-associated protein, TIGR04073 family [Geobacter sp.]